MEIIFFGSQIFPQSKRSFKKNKNIKDFSSSLKKIIAEANINIAKIEKPFRESKKSKHLITISKNSSNDENNNNENILDDIKSPINIIKKNNKI